MEANKEMPFMSWVRSKAQSFLLPLTFLPWACSGYLEILRNDVFQRVESVGFAPLAVQHIPVSDEDEMWEHW